LSEEYAGRGIEIKEVATGFRIQIRSGVRDWLDALFEERAPRYTRALLEILALIAYRQPITRAEIEGVRGVVVSTNIVRTLLDRGWVRVVGYRDVPGKPSMLGTTREFLDYFGLRKLDDLPPLAELKDMYPETSPQSDLVDVLEGVELSAVHVGDGERSLIDDDEGMDADEWADEDEQEPATPLHLVTKSEPH
jgi:segregation and condensation protein B